MLLDLDFFLVQTICAWRRTLQYLAEIVFHMVFDMKHFLQNNCCMVAGGNLVCIVDIQVYSLMIK